MYDIKKFRPYFPWLIDPTLINPYNTFKLRNPEFSRMRLLLLSPSKAVTRELQGNFHNFSLFNMLINYLYKLLHLHIR